MSDLTRALLDDTLPPGPLWEPEESGDLDNLLDGIGDNLEAIRAFVATLSDVRNPNTTSILDDLEREYGIPTNTLLSEATRRLRLSELVYGVAGNGTEDNLQAALRNVGFDVYVYQNDPAVDPAIFLAQAFQMVAGGGNAYAGRADAFASISGGELLVNGEIFTTERLFTSGAGSGFYAGTGHGAGEYDDLQITKQEYPIPTDPADWPFVFFVGGTVTREYYNVSTAQYNGIFHDMSTEDTNPTGVVFSVDGLKMYIVGTTNGKIYQYSLTTAFDVNTASYDTVFLDVTTEDTNPTGLFIKSDGTMMWMVGSTGDKVYQYSFVTPWDLSTASYDTVFFSVATEATFPTGMYFSSDGLKMFVVGSSTNRVYEYDLGVAWDISTAAYNSISLDISTEDTSASDIFFKPDGLGFWIIGNTNNKVFQYKMTTAWDLSTAAYENVFISVENEDKNPRGLFFNTDGSRMFTIDTSNDRVYQYDLDNTNGAITSIANATIDGAREDEFKRTILSIKPLHSWAALIVNYS